MAQGSLLEQPVVVHTRPAIDMDDEQFFQFCQVNRDLQIERTAEGDIIIMAPEAGSSGLGSGKLTMTFGIWAAANGTGQIFGSSTGFILPNGATRSPDVAWVRRFRWDVLDEEDKERCAPICPDFVVELRSPSDRVKTLQAKMEEYRDNGAQLGWLIDPETRTVEVYRPGREPELLTGIESIAGEGPVDGFTLDLRTVWDPLAP